MASRWAALLLALMAAPACFGGTDADLTEGGEGKPVVSVEFLPVVEPSTSEVLTLTVENPGPGDLDSTVVAFAALGASDLPDALVGFGAGGRNRSIVSIDPKPRGVSADGASYTFEGLREGDTTTIEFTIRTPGVPGSYANSVIVSDGSDPSRSRGVPLRTEVRVGAGGEE